MGFRLLLHDRVDQRIELAGVNVTVFQNIKARHLKFLESGQCRVPRVGIEGSDLFTEQAQHLIQNRRNHGFAHAALALLNEMHCCHRIDSYGVKCRLPGSFCAGRETAL